MHFIKEDPIPEVYTYNYHQSSFCIKLSHKIFLIDQKLYTFSPEGPGGPVSPRGPYSP